MSTQERILRVGLIEAGRIVEERLHRGSRDFVVGSRPGASLLLSQPSGAELRFRILRGRRLRLELDPRRVSGRIASAGEVRELEPSGSARESGRREVLLLDERARGRLQVGDSRVLFQLVAAPPPPPRLRLPAGMRAGLLRGLDLRLLGMIALSAALQLGALQWTLRQDWPTSARAQALDDRFVTVFVAPRPPGPSPEPEVRRPEPAAELATAPGVAQRAPRRPAPAAKRPPAPDPEARARGEARRRARLARDVRDRTVIKYLVGDRAAGGQGLVAELTAPEVRQGVAEAFEGSRGIALAGGVAEPSRRRATRAPQGARVGIEGLLPERSVRGRRVASAVPRRERRAGKLGERLGVTGRIRLPQKTPSTSGSGDLAAELIRQRVRGRLRQVISCYERELKKDPRLGGKLVVRFTIGPAGRITAKRSIGGSLRGSAVERCVLRRMQAWAFPRPAGGSVTVAYPLVFTPSSVRSRERS